MCSQWVWVTESPSLRHLESVGRDLWHRLSQTERSALLPVQAQLQAREKQSFCPRSLQSCLPVIGPWHLYVLPTGVFPCQLGKGHFCKPLRNFRIHTNSGNNDVTWYNISNSCSSSEPWNGSDSFFLEISNNGEKGGYLTRGISESLAVLRAVCVEVVWIAFSTPTPHPRRPPWQGGTERLEASLNGKNYSSLTSGNGTGSPRGWATAVSLFHIPCWQPLGCVKGEAMGICRSMIY